MKREDDSLKLEGEAPSDYKSDSMEREHALLKQSELKLEAGEPPAKKMKQSELDGEALSDNKPSSSIESEDASLNQSELGGRALSDNILPGSTERDDDSLKQSMLGGRTQSDNKPSSSMERNDDSLKLGGGTQTVQFSLCM